MARISSGFYKADSRNLPRVDNVMILEYMAVNSNHNIAEIRGAKALMSSRDSYLRTAVGYVEVKRDADYCVIRAKVVPEHRVGNKMYAVTAKIKEAEDIIEESLCEDCPASAGGCKHSLLLLFWLAKISSEPSTTSVTCYWVKPNLSSARSEYLLCNTFGGSKRPKLQAKDSNILADFQKECESRGIADSLATCFCDWAQTNPINIFDIAIEFLEKETDHGFGNFKNYADSKVTQSIKDHINEKTVNQSNAKYWHYVRQGRVTASNLHEAAHCSTDGALVQQLLGGYKVPDTAAMKRGRKLEEQVIKEIEKKLNVKIKKSGFILIDSIFGASPDGLHDDFVVEIKCPNSERTVKTYVKNNVIQENFKAQINCQMLAANKSKGLFCVASPSFETNKEINMYWVQKDDMYVMEEMMEALKFWEKFLFPKLIASAEVRYNFTLV